MQDFGELQGKSLVNRSDRTGHARSIPYYVFGARTVNDWWWFGLNIKVRMFPVP